MPAKKSKISVSKKLSDSVVARRASKAKTANDLTAKLYDTKGKVVGELELPKEIFGAKINENLMSQAVRVYLANQRRGTVSTKTRGEVSGSTRKIWRQKGTGRARHGSIKAPIFVGGGIVSGPKPRDFSLKLPKKMKRIALFSALTNKLEDNEIKFATGFEKIEPKTKAMATAFSKLGINGEKKKILLITPGPEKTFPNIYRAARNIEGVNIVVANQLSVYEVLNNNLILFMKNAVALIKDTFLRKGSLI